MRRIELRDGEKKKSREFSAALSCPRLRSTHEATSTTWCLPLDDLFTAWSSPAATRCCSLASIPGLLGLLARLSAPVTPPTPSVPRRPGLPTHPGHSLVSDDTPPVQKSWQPQTSHPVWCSSTLVWCISFSALAGHSLLHRWLTYICSGHRGHRVSHLIRQGCSCECATADSLPGNATIPCRHCGAGPTSFSSQENQPLMAGPAPPSFHTLPLPHWLPPPAIHIRDVAQQPRSRRVSPLLCFRSLSCHSTLCPHALTHPHPALGCYPQQPTASSPLPQPPFSAALVHTNTTVYQPSLTIHPPTCSSPTPSPPSPPPSPRNGPTRPSPPTSPPSPRSTPPLPRLSRRTSRT